MRHFIRIVSSPIHRLLALLAVVALCSSAVLAQQTLGGITGEVSDSSGGVIPGATVSVVTVVVMILICLFDLRSATDATHARIPWIYLGYIAAGLAWYFLRRRQTVALSA